MLSIVGTYKDGQLKLDKEYFADKPVKVVVTFLEEVQSKTAKGLMLSDFSFAKSRENLKDVESSFSDTVAAERRAEL